jgi:hypothetical protein
MREDEGGRRMEGAGKEQEEYGEGRERARGWRGQGEWRSFMMKLSMRSVFYFLSGVNQGPQNILNSLKFGRTQDLGREGRGRRRGREKNQRRE